MLVGAATVVILTGTLVTGSGPHSGHNEDDVTQIRRLPIAVHDAATAPARHEPGGGRCEGRGDQAFGVCTSLMLANSRMPQGPSSRPTPERFTPPKGRSGAVSAWPLT